MGAGQHGGATTGATGGAVSELSLYRIQSCPSNLPENRESTLSAGAAPSAGQAAQMAARLHRQARSAGGGLIIVP